MSDHQDQQPGHLIERAAARLKASNAALLREGAAGGRMVLLPEGPGKGADIDGTARSVLPIGDDAPAPPLPTTQVPGFKPLVLQPQSLIQPIPAHDAAYPPAFVTEQSGAPPTAPAQSALVQSAPAQSALVQSLQPLPVALTPPLDTSSHPAPPASFTHAVSEDTAGPIPAPSPPLTRPPAPRALNASPALSIRAAAAPRPGAGAPALSVAGLTPRSPSGIVVPAPPVLQLDALERAGMVVARTTRTRISEEYRIAIGRILRTLHEATDVQGARNVLMVTSARPGEGKSFTALNLAGSIAQNGTEAVLLVDVDPKVKPLSDQLGLGEAQGFLDLVADPSLRPEDLLHVTAISNLAIMPVGTRLGGAAQTAGGTASMRPIIPTVTRLARRFPKHLIMLDAPPCLSTSDPHTLAPHVGQIVLVVEAERTQRTEVEAAVDLVRVCPTITMLLNKVRMTTSHTFGAYDYFGSYT